MSEVIDSAGNAGARLLRERLRRPVAATPRAGSIPPVPRDAALPLSFAQQRLWVLDQLRPGGSDYLVPVVLRLGGALSVPALSAALNAVIRRHEILRTRYPLGPGGTPIQVIDPHVEEELPVDDLTGGEQDWLDTLLEADTGAPFDLATGPVMRTRLIRLAPEDHLLVMVFHHIAMDGWSSSLLVRELAAGYAADAAVPPPPLAAQYADFAGWQRTRVAGDRLARGVEHWLDRLAGLPPLELPTDRPRPAVWDPSGETVRFTLPAALVDRIDALARSRRATPFMVYLAGLWALLARYSGQDDFAVATPAAGRTHEQTEGLLGVFINLLVLRADLAGDPGFDELVDRARSTSLDAYDNQEVPFEYLVAELSSDRDLATHPLVQVNLVLQNTEPVRFEAGGVTGTEVPIVSRGAKFDLTWTLEERPDGSVGGEVTFARALFGRSTAERMARHYVRLLEAALAAPGRRIGDLPMLSESELGDLVRGPAGTAPAEPCLHERFAEQARLTPEAVAIRCGDETVSYAELDARANQLAWRLRELGVGREDLAGLCLPRSTATVVAVLGVLKAGGGYLPLDPDQPADRTGLLLRDAGVTVLVTTTALAARVATAKHCLVVDDPAEQDLLAARPTTAPSTRTDSGDRAYVIYTSGSTGHPKGVEVSHGNVVRLLTATAPEYRFGPEDRWALFHSYAFDVSVWEIWGALLHGGRLVIVTTEVARSPWDLVELLADEGITVLNQTPSAFHRLVDLAGRGEPSLDRLRLRLVILAGEPVDVAALAPWWRRYPAVQVVNKYGITETTVHVTYRPLGPADLGGDRSPIGRPIRDLTMYVLDAAMRPAPAGVPGEIHVGGPGVARGYLGRPALTADRFVPDPFGPPGARLYRSGDKARVLANGDIGFLGRFDHQVKIRGFRVEPGEVESFLATHPDVETAIVTVEEPAPGDRRLVAYLVPKTGAGLATAEVRRYATERLPGYLVPAFFVVLPALPLTTNGKVDRRALPRPDNSRRERESGYVAARTATEAAVAEVWSQVLDVEAVGMHDNFFALGGDSIRAVRLVGLLRSQGYGVSVQDLFRHQTVADLAAHTVPAESTTELVGVPPFSQLAPDDRAKLPDSLVDAYPLSMGQAGMVYEMLADPDRNLYHNVTSYLIRDDGPFTPAALDTAVRTVLLRHEVLRTSFDLHSCAEPVQLVHPTATVHTGHRDLRGTPAAELDAILAAFRDTERSRPFDLSRAPLFRVHSHRIGEHSWYLSFTECHAILDGWSHNSIITELLGEYRANRAGRRPPEPTAPAVRYADFVAQERQSLRSARDRAFWADRLPTAQRLTIPAAWADPDGQPWYDVVVPIDDLADRLRAVAARASASVKSVLLAAHIAVWQAISGRHRFHFGLVCHGRAEVEDGDRVRGMFLNPVPFLAPAGESTWIGLVAAAFDEEVELWPYRRFPLQEMQRVFGDGNRLLEVVFNYLDFHILDRETVDTAGTTDDSPNEFPLAVSTEPGALVLTGQSARIGRRHAELLGAMYRNALVAIANEPDGSLRRSLLPHEERQRLLAVAEGPRRPVPPRAVHELVFAHAKKVPDAVAVEAPAGRLSYRELTDRALDWTARLRTLGIGRGGVVGVLLRPGLDLVAGVLGVLSAGAAYIPLDSHHPPERIARLLRDSGASAVITAPDLVPGLPPGLPKLVPGLSHGPRAGNPAVAASDPDDLAYIVHTSGSTGRPKGVMVSHGALADRVLSMSRRPGVDPRDVLVLVVPAITDVAQLDLFTPLVAGARVVLDDGDLARDPVSLAALLRRSAATIAEATPTTWRLLADTGWTPPAGFTVASGGEPMSPELANRLRASGAELWDMYGPNEATIFCTGTRLPTDGPAEWQAADNTSVHVLDEALEPMPVGVVGQIFVGGDGLARGYLGAPGATAAVFLPDPHAAKPGARLYATGDLGRRAADGRVEILGRIDHQLKVRGFRVEVGEVENAILAHPAVRAAVVHPVRAGDGAPQLAAYLVTEQDGLTPEQLRSFLGRTLPEHLLPTHLITVDAFPTLPNGKVDRAALPGVEAAATTSAADHDPPQGEVEEAIASVWAEVLGLDRVGRHDDFAAVGGHSLLTMKIIARLRDGHGVELTFRDFVERPTVRGLGEAAADRAPVRSALLWLGHDGASPPLWCVHPGGGSGHWYQALSREFAGRRPLAAFEWPGLHGVHWPAHTSADIAGRYLAELRAAHPRGPYHLLGWCGSSGIAWEIAQRLHAAGEQVRLVLLDPVVDVSERSNAAHLAKLEVFRHAEKLFGQLRNGGSDPAPRAELVAVLRDVVDDGDLIGEDDLGEAWADRLRSWRGLLQARLGYHFDEYPGSLQLVLCNELVEERHESIEGMSYADYLGRWRRLATGGVTVHRVPGDHLGVLRPPHVHTLAEVLDAALSEPANDQMEE